MFKYTDPIIIKHNQKRKEWEKRHPNRNWKTGLSQSQKNDLADEMGEPEIKKDLTFEDNLLEYLRESGHISD